MFAASTSGGAAVALLADVAVHERVTWVVHHVVQILATAGVGQLVERRDVPVAMGLQRIADEDCCRIPAPPVTSTSTIFSRPVVGGLVRLEAEFIRLGVGARFGRQVQHDCYLGADALPAVIDQRWNLNEDPLFGPEKELVHRALWSPIRRGCRPAPA